MAKKYKDFDVSKLERIENEVINVFATSNLSYAEAAAIVRELPTQLSERAYFKVNEGTDGNE